MGLVRSVIQIDPSSEKFIIVVQGICRFILDATVSEKPLKINKIKVIANFKELSGRYKNTNV